MKRRVSCAVGLVVALVMTASASAQDATRKTPLSLAPPAAERTFSQPPVAGLKAAEPAGVLAQAWLWVLAGQREMSGAMTTAVRQLRSGSTVSSSAILAAISFLYGVLHAVGPGHGKFVISSYALASERTVRRAILLSFMAAGVQALSAIVLVGALAIIARATSVQMRATEAWLETASWGLIALFGAWLLYGQLRAMLSRRATSHTHHEHHGAHHHGHGHRHDHECEACGHSHLPAPEALGGAWSWTRAWSLAFSIGVRPCTGAIGVMLVALSIGIFWAGVFATIAMAVGTAITVSALAAFAVGSRELARRFAGGESRWASRIETTAGLCGSALVFILGATFFVASLQTPPPL